MADAFDLIRLRDATHLGISIDSVHRRARAGELIRIHPGVYMLATQWAKLRPEDQLRARVHASHGRLRHDHIYSHESAAVMLGIPLLGQLPKRPHVLDASAAARSSAAFRRTVRTVEETDTVLTDGIRTTNLLVTAIDVAATRSPLGGVMAFSKARRAGVSAEDLEVRVAELGAIRGARQLRLALRTSSSACDSPLEALVLARCEDLGFERPEQQRVIRTTIGDFPVDFTWNDGIIALEADGYVKYTDPEMLDGRTSAHAVIAEKRREDAIRAEVDRFGRTGWAEALAGVALERKLERMGVPRIHRSRALRC